MAQNLTGWSISTKIRAMLYLASIQGHKLLEHMQCRFWKERLRVRKIVKIHSMQFKFIAGRSTTDAISIVGQLQDKYLAKKKDSWIAFLIWRKHLIIKMSTA